ncbi:lantibiotic dehydratase [Actinokineospora sp. UTMC 2448]|uniref:lantibiotic dehydratase n=1 Tax=Actinokineospora sp. UTMC 2448 TaxID=2268449 RepID=UPI002164D64E|nr:lantibiotic dehydratase [Actinokineospora sp. UTMC 2448]UVS80487.1 thiopeptide-type bacteriocin biosynthesis domain protein [Actinokineospora sp. UTMC 2448]
MARRSAGGDKAARRRSDEHYRAIDAAVVRVTAQPPAPDTAPPDPDAGAVRWRAWVDAVWSDDWFAAAVALASPELADRVRQVRAGAVLTARGYRRLGDAIVRYRLRATTRATPFGLFAGVAPARIGVGPTTLDLRRRAPRYRPDARWLAAVGDLVQARTDLNARVVVNPLAFVRDGRLVLNQVPTGDEPAAEVSVRHTAVVRAVQRIAATPLPMTELLRALRSEFPSAPEGAVDALAAELIRHTLLVTELRPAMTDTDPLGHVLRFLPEKADLRHELGSLHQDIACLEGKPLEAEQLTERMRAVAPAERYLGADLAFRGTLVLPRSVGLIAEAAATALARLASSGPGRFQRFHQRFLERYGPGAVVPISDLVNADTGLGYPDGYRDSVRDPEPTEADTRMLVLAYDAARSGATEIVLDDSTIAELATETSVPDLELTFALHARSRARLDQGDFTLAVVGGSRAVGTLTGRFLDLLEEADRNRMVAAYSALPQPGSLQVSGPPLYRATENVARVPASLPRVVHVAEFPGPGTVPIADLAVWGTSHRLHVVSLTTGDVVHPRVLNAVELTHRAHPLVRLLSDIATAGSPNPAMFPWGIAGRLPFLPRVRYGQAVLAPARWRVTADDFAHDRRGRDAVPETVVLAEGDQRLTLDLARDHHLRQVHRALRRHGTVTLIEAPPQDAYDWLDGHAHEIVLPLVARKPPGGRHRVLACPTRTSHARLPARHEWLHAKIYAHPGSHTAILARLSDLDALDWWFLPYRDPDDHLRVRFRHPQGEPVVGRIADWVDGLRRRGLTNRIQFDTHLPEVGRFGDGPVLAAAEAVFVADSTIAVRRRVTRTEPVVLAAAGVAEIAAHFHGDTRTGLRWLVDHVPRSAPPRDLPAVAMQAAALDPSGDVALVRRQKALADYRGRRVEHALDPDGVLPSLLHLHCVRVLGLDTERERVAHQVARALALSWLARRGQPP